MIRMAIRDLRALIGLWILHPRDREMVMDAWHQAGRKDLP
jgi:hypothetical protein